VVHFKSPVSHRACHFYISALRYTLGGKCLPTTVVMSWPVYLAFLHSRLDVNCNYSGGGRGAYLLSFFFCR